MCAGSERGAGCGDIGQAGVSFVGPSGRTCRDSEQKRGNPGILVQSPILCLLYVVGPARAMYGPNEKAPHEAALSVKSDDEVS